MSALITSLALASQLALAPTGQPVFEITEPGLFTPAEAQPIQIAMLETGGMHVSKAADADASDSAGHGDDGHGGSGHDGGHGGEHGGGGHGGHDAHGGGPVQMDPRATPVPFDSSLFGGGPVYPEFKYNAAAQIEIYGGKSAVPSPPFIYEGFRPMYSSGSIGDGFPLLGEKNPVSPQLLVYGDFRTAVAYNDDQGRDIAQVATRFNVDIDFKITATERIHAFIRPLDRGGKFTRYEFGGGDFDEKVDPDVLLTLDPTTLFFEGDYGALAAGFTDEYKPYDLPFTFGRVPLLMQNGVWIEDAFLGAAFAIPARNSQRFDISNFDITFFAGFDEITSDAFIDANGKRADHDANMYGVAGFFEFDQGYLETGYAYMDDRDPLNGDHSYHNLTIAFTKRYFGKISNSMRVIANVGQDPGPGFAETADGTLFLLENSLITSKPSTFIPYANFWAGFGKTQSVARAGDSEDILRNTGITLESDGMTGYPTLDATAIDTVGGAIGIENLFNLNQQLVVEVSAVVPHGDESGPAQDVQLGAGIRFQRPLSKAVIFRMDAMYGHFGDDNPSSTGLRMELRRKF